MKKDYEEMNLTEKMFAVMKDAATLIKDLEVEKEDQKYIGLSHDAVTEAIKEQCIEKRILVLTSVLNHSVRGELTEVDIEVRFVNVDNPEDIYTVSGYGQGVSESDVGSGIAISYAFKYVILKNFLQKTREDPERHDDRRDIDPSGDDKLSYEQLAERARTLVSAVGGWRKLKQDATRPLGDPQDLKYEDLEVIIAECKDLLRR